MVFGFYFRPEQNTPSGSIGKFFGAGFGATKSGDTSGSQLRL
jgi:hypothetical protein